MGDDYKKSETSWRKMVIGKANNEWTSTIKTEQSGPNISVNTTQFSTNDSQKFLRDVKKESEDVQIYEENNDEPEVMLQEVDPLIEDGNLSPSDPLSADEPMKRRRRRGSVPKSESPEERAARLAKMSAYAAQRLANETPEQRAIRLRRMSDYAAKRLAQETSEQRARRLARMSAYAAKRLAEESPEQRSARLARMSAYAARRQAMKKTTKHSLDDHSKESSPFV